jgi:hypothetical protein
LEARREAVLEQMRALRSMRPGTVSEQFLEVPHKGQARPVRRGPYYLWQYYEAGRPMRQRLTSPEEVERARADVDAHRRFTALCREFEALTRQLGELERELPEAPELKKKSKLPSNKTKR